MYKSAPLNSGAQIFVSQPFISRSLGSEKYLFLHLFYNADMQFRQNNKRFNRISYLYYTHFQTNIYWNFIQKVYKIPKTHGFRGLKCIFDFCPLTLGELKNPILQHNMSICKLRVSYRQNFIELHYALS